MPRSTGRAVRSSSTSTTGASGLTLRGAERVLVHNRLRAAIGLRYEMPLLLRGVTLPPSATTLEIGAGTGWGSRGLLRALQPTLAVVTDFDPHVLVDARREVRREQGRAAVAVADAKRLPFGDSTFDLVLSLFALHHVMGYGTALKEVGRVLKPGGLFLFAEPLAAFPLPRLRAFAGPDGLPTPRDLRAMLAASGLSLELERGLPFWRYVRARRVEPA